jgi:hypothetical protein
MMNDQDSEEASSKKPRRRKNKKNKPSWPETDDFLIMKIKWMINYCMDCVTWDEAKPILDMIEKFVGQNAPPYLVAAITKVKTKFGQMIYGHTVKTKRVNMYHTVIKGPMNKVTKNKEVKL